MTMLTRGEVAEPVAKRLSLPFLDDLRAGVSGAEPASGGKAKLRPKQVRRNWRRISAIVMIGVPTLLAALYYAFIAAPQYSVEVRFAVRGGTHASAPSGGSDLISSLAGFSSGGSTMSDAYIVMDFVKSREIIEKMSPLVDIRSVYGNPAADLVMRLKSSAKIEDVVDYWRWMIDVNLDTISQIITVKVRAFSREDAVRVSEGVLTFSEELINNLSERARLDTVKFAEQEAQHARWPARRRKGTHDDVAPLHAGERTVGDVPRKPDQGPGATGRAGARQARQRTRDAGRVQYLEQPGRRL